MSETIRIGGAVIAQNYGYGTIAVFLISLLSLLGVVLVPFLSKTYYSYLILGLIALAIGTMSGDAFLHLIPQALGLHEHGPGEHGGHGTIAIRSNVSLSNLTTVYDSNAHHDHDGHGHSSSEGGSTLPPGHDMVWKLLVVIGTIFFFHLMEVLLRFLQDKLDTKKGKGSSGHHHHHHSHSDQQMSDSHHNHLVLPALAIPMHPSKKKKETGSANTTEGRQQNPEEYGLENRTLNGSLATNRRSSHKNHVKDQNLFRKWLSKRDGSASKSGSCFLGDVTINDPSTLSKINSNSSAKLVICPQNYLQAHENHMDIVGLYDGLRVQGSTPPPTDPTKESQGGKFEFEGGNVDNSRPNDGGGGTPVLLRVCLNDGLQRSDPCILDNCDQTSVCKAETCNANAPVETERLEHRHHEHKHDHTSCHHRDIMQAADIINTRKRELYQAQIISGNSCNNPLTSCPEKRLNKEKEGMLSNVPTTGDLITQNNVHSSREKFFVNDALTTFGEEGGENGSFAVSNAPGHGNTGNKSLGGVTGLTHNDSVYTTCPEQLLLESTNGVEKDNTIIQTINHDRLDDVKFKGRIGLPFCYGIQSLSLFLILGDVAHNIVDGIAIGAAFSSSLKEGLSTSFAVFCHELPHELGDFAVLISTGMSFKMALMVNLFAACTSFLGLYISLSFAASLAARQWIFAMTAGMFLYVSLVDMLPELREIKVGSQIWSLFCQNLGIIVGVGLMLLVALYEHLLF